MENPTMKTFDLKSLLIGVFLTMCIVVIMLIATASGTRAWEYKTLSSVAMGDIPAMNKLGDEGWELVGFTHWKHPTGQGNDYSYFVFKRAKSSAEKWKLWK